MIRKNSMKDHYQRKKIFNDERNINDADYNHAKGVCKDF